MTANDASSSPCPICKHGIIGDLRTCALVTTQGAIDFWCWPELDSPSLFSALLDNERAGAFTLSPQGEGWRSVQFYLPDSNILQTRWLSQHSVVELNDFMPVQASAEALPCIVRRVKVAQGEATLTMRCSLKFDYARLTPDLQVLENTALWQAENQQTVTLNASVPLTAEEGAVQSQFTLRCGEEAFFILGSEAVTAQGQKEVERLHHDTLAFWQQWVGKNKYRGRWREMVIRSSLVLKLLSSTRHGSIAAAATFGLPELIGGERNWDYRAGWIRDASFSCYALIRLGYIDEAKAFGHWVRTCMENSQFEPDKLQVMYRLDSGTDLQEHELPHLAGHFGSTPVRIGNGAYQQRQLDIYGELLDTLYLTTKYGDGIPHRGWQHVIRLVDHVCDIWNSPDAGIWEMRGEPEHFLYSRLMCWVALDRALRLGAKRSLSMPYERWESVRQAIREDIWTHFWNPDLGHFTSTRHGSDLDGSMLLMPLFRFVSAKDPDWLATLDAIKNKLVRGGMVRRYIASETPADSLHGEEGYFVACSFWYVECLARADRLEEARIEFEKVLIHANHLGLYAEEFDPLGNALGNFPQALSHLALISAAYYLDKKMAGDELTWQP
ncbi:glycoside hydrolase family 15 protein [Franconibacter sp. IITDAS19]|uniref:glycoside hydrolase family 15 protein n=1 Tax=Franconibacter sp. IITDAS19 TaxID=2930569 RepID=UPI001FFA53C1|nr:glycoside hydrolase family 15 protein [Franconibacter sp. IITDAS19]MCK1967887.1 glycoside hydrolase family 15 protein [Franconibacter sp. IITDAS19]